VAKCKLHLNTDDNAAATFGDSFADAAFADAAGANRPYILEVLPLTDAESELLVLIDVRYGDEDMDPSHLIFSIS
jgi:hypothetical protein